MKKVISSFVAVILSLVFGGTRLHAADLKVGDPAPDFSLKGSDGKTYNLKDFEGKQPVVLAWFPKAFTGGCTKECRSFQTESDAMKKFDVAYFTASVDTPKKNADFANSLEVKDYVILADPSKETAKAYGVYNKVGGYASRWTFYIGKDGKILAIEKKINTEHAGREVADKLKELGIPEKSS